MFCVNFYTLHNIKTVVKMMMNDLDYDICQEFLEAVLWLMYILILLPVWGPGKTTGSFCFIGDWTDVDGMK